MGLIDLKTDLKSLRYGKDRLGGGSSNQPYIKSKIPTNEGDLGAKGGPDFLLRGGLLTPGRILKDTSRLTQMFFDFRSPNGLLFTAKQNVLSRTAVATNGKEKALNNGVYLPTSTILGAAGNPIGLHLNKQGINPFAGIYTGNNSFLTLISDFDPLGNPVYSSLVNVESKSRLEDFLDDKINRKKKSNEGNDLFSYPGGPGSILGVGKTTISLSKDRTGINNTEVEKFKFANVDWVNSKYTEGNQTKIQESKLLDDPIIRFKITNDKDKRVGASLKYVSEFKTTSTPITSLFQFDGKANKPPSVYKPNTLKTNTEIAGGNTLTQEQLVEKQSAAKTGIYNTENFITNIPGAPSYLKTDYSLNNRIEQRVNLGNPGKKEKDNKIALDIINYRQIYKTDQNVVNVPQVNDLVKFRIGVIDNKEPSKKTNIHFRAFIDSMSDSYSADWQAQKFMGRGENFYRYNGFDRKVSLSWTVVAQSKAELIPMYQKLNYLASVCAPDYSDLGYMRGNLIKLTIGGYLYEQVGIMTSITYDVPQESPWEIAIPYASSDENTSTGVKSDSSVKELPHMIKVTGFQFIPIHDFVPSVQRNRFGKNNSGKITKYGNERYIALDNGVKPNYDTKTTSKPIVFPLTSTLPRPSIQPFPLSTPLSTEIII
jgi:hypothetical protein